MRNNAGALGSLSKHMGGEGSPPASLLTHKPGSLTSHQWLYTPDCEVLHGINGGETHLDYPKNMLESPPKDIGITSKTQRCSHNQLVL